MPSRTATAGYTWGVLVTLLACLGAVLAAMTALWGVSVAVRDASIVDIFWGPAFVLVAWVAAR